jgi:Tfp pilus assembly PilM family ATPase
MIHSANEDLLPNLITQCLHLGFQYNQRKSTTIVVIPKLGGRNPKKPSSYRPISLNSVLGNLVEKIAAMCIATYARQCRATKISQFGLVGHGSAVDGITATIASLT